MKSIASIVLVSVSALVGATSAQATPTITLVGDTVDASMNFTANSGYGVGRISGYGLDHPFVVVDGISDKQLYANIFTLDVDGSSFAIKFLQTAKWVNGVEFKLTGLDFSSGGTLTSVGVNSNLSGYSLSNNAHELDINFSNVSFTANSFLVGTFNVAAASVNAVPEPTSIALAGLALGMAGLAMKRRRAAAGTGHAA